VENFSFLPTPLQFYKTLSEELGVKLRVKHDDLFQACGGGNKARKLQYSVKAAQKEGHNAIVTTGGAQSNHVRATALMTARLGWKAIMVVHGEEPKTEIYQANLKLARLSGAKIRFVKADNVASAMDQSMEELKNDGYNPYYMRGGGHCVAGCYSYYDAVKEVKAQLKPEDYPDYLVLASGTGATQAGLIAGCGSLLPGARVLGISVSRNKERGSQVIHESLRELNGALARAGENAQEIHFDDAFVGEGYEAAYPRLLETIEWAAKAEGLVLDPTYTGKAFWGLVDYVRKGAVAKGANVLFWHTGGIFNLMASKDI
jgi:1-aminocyclopropane-1-carboxylate deaminase/D-cysteine desulfhydrase-like pyridoxal-dependent ACC family enzyme